jgi:hypothetical protein
VICSWDPYNAVISRKITFWGNHWKYYF